MCRFRFADESSRLVSVFESQVPKLFMEVTSLQVIFKMCEHEGRKWQKSLYKYINKHAVGTEPNTVSVHPLIHGSE